MKTAGGLRIDPDMLARAEAALRALSVEFGAWMAEELAALEAARAAVHANPSEPAAWDELHHRTHDLKGLGTTYGSPLATRLCTSLHRLLDDHTRRGAASLELVDAHVDAVRRAVEAEGAEPSDATCAALEARVAETLGRRSG